MSPLLGAFLSFPRRRGLRRFPIACFWEPFAKVGPRVPPLKPLGLGYGEESLQDGAPFDEDEPFSRATFIPDLSSGCSLFYPWCRKNSTDLYLRGDKKEMRLSNRKGVVPTFPTISAAYWARNRPMRSPPLRTPLGVFQINFCLIQSVLVNLFGKLWPRKTFFADDRFFSSLFKERTSEVIACRLDVGSRQRG